MSNLSIGRMGNTHRLGIPHTDETREKLKSFQRSNLIRQSNKSGCNGVTWLTRDKRWKAYICYDGNQVNLGQYTVLEEAIAARKAGELKYWGVA